MDEKKIIHSTNYYFTINVLSIITTENLQASSDEAFIYFLGGWVLQCDYFFSVKQNVKDIFVDGHRRKEWQEETNISKLIGKVKLDKIF